MCGRNWSRVALGITLLACVVPVRAAGVALVDDRGITVRLTSPASRIVTLSPHLAEIVFAAGAGAKLAGVARFSDYPEAARRLPLIGDAARIDAERVVQIGPDLVLAWKSGNPAAGISRLEQLGFTVYVSEPARLADIPRVLRAVGALAGTAIVADEAANNLFNIINSLRKSYADRPPVRVFYEIWHRPLLTVNGAHIISDVIRLCGGRNVFADAPSLTPEVSLEAVLAADPEVILGGGSAGGERQFAEPWRTHVVGKLRTIPAFYVPPDAIQRQTPRIAEGAAAICGHLERVRARRSGSGQDR